MVSHYTINNEVVIEIGNYKYRIEDDNETDWNRFCQYLENENCSLKRIKTDIGRRKLIDHWLFDFKIKESARI